MKILQFINYSAYFKIKKEYYTALESIDLDVEKGEFLAIVGPSGCGKTTLLRSVMGLVPYFSGELLLDGKKIEETDVSTQNIAYVSQEVTLYPSMTIYENIAYPLKVMGLVEDEIDRRVRDLAAQMGIGFLLTRKPRQLSVGQRQRVALAHALVKGPRLALFDEPFSNLEPQLRRELGTLLREIHRQQGSTFLFVTHDVEEAYALADRVVTLEQGAVRQIDAPKRRIPEGAVQETVWQAPLKSEAKPRQPWKWLCLATALLAVIIGASVFHERTAVPEDVRLKISFVGTGLDAQRMEEDLLAALAAEGLEVREIVMDSLRYDDGYTQGSAVWVRSREADLMIFTEEFLFDQIGVIYFLPLSGDWPEDHIYREGQTDCGLLPGPRFSEYYDGEGSCVLFLTDAGAEKPAALAAARWLLEEG